MFGVYAFVNVIEKVAGPFSKTKEMTCFQQLMSPEAKFCWSHDLEETFNQAKERMMDRVRSGAATFDPGLLLSTGTEEEAEWLRGNQLASSTGAQISVRIR